MAASIKDIKEVQIPQEYELIKAEFVEEADSFVLTLRHRKSQARVVVFSNEDENKVFNIGFRTPPKDASGVPHIIEHTVLLEGVSIAMRIQASSLSLSVVA